MIKGTVKAGRHGQWKQGGLEEGRYTHPVVKSQVASFWKDRGGRHSTSEAAKHCSSKQSCQLAVLRRE
eukprot:76921-Rhodomonas_salina.2